MGTEEDVERYAGFIAGHPEAITEVHRQAARAVLDALVGDGRLLPAGGVTRTEYGLDQSSATVITGILAIGVGMRAKAVASHERECTVWPQPGANNYWARYVTAWEERVKEDA